MSVSGCQTTLYSHENRYYLFVDFNELPDEEVENQLSILLEYASESKMTIHMLKEYGKLIAADHALHTIKSTLHKKPVSFEAGFNLLRYGEGFCELYEQKNIMQLNCAGKDEEAIMKAITIKGSTT